MLHCEHAKEKCHQEVEVSWSPAVMRRGRDAVYRKQAAEKCRRKEEASWFIAEMHGELGTARR